MGMQVTNPASAGDINVHGFRIYFRNKTRLTATVDASTTVPVENARWFAPGDILLIGGPGESEQVTVDSIAGNTITLTVATTGTFDQGAPLVRRNFWHMGHVRNPDWQQEREVQEIFSAITGKSQKVKEIVTSVTKGINFESISSADPLVRALHTGNPRLAGVISGTDVFVDDVNSVDGEMLAVLPNAETGGIAFVMFRPAAQLSGDGFAQGADGENEDALSFTATFNADDSYTIPVALAAGNIPAPLGVVVKTPNDDLEDVIDVFADLTA